MSKRVVLKLDGNLEQGFRVTLEIGEEGNVHFKEEAGHLPPSPKIIQCLDEWQKNYRQLSGNTRITLNNITVQTGALSQNETCRMLAKELEKHLKTWLESDLFYPIDRTLQFLARKK
ncbi:hypothetical protein F7734_06270 [Scytonema sp. UIC 10036]|uniref:hypothetical protein n=1 Tax=Scytonema sp. UIC 10036 TaxID=2304196 RepID=UPI0012DAD1F5|nr:hypothetical protein [Scytonema sp. UIC 10036]MUG92083.1 hypothetical protein [Scytonema sp. UIC 10036]